MHGIFILYKCERDGMLVGSAAKTENNVGSLHDCIGKCLEEINFICMAINFKNKKHRDSTRDTDICDMFPYTKFRENSYVRLSGMSDTTASWSNAYYCTVGM